jgi:hypothetical protein
MDKQVDNLKNIRSSIEELDENEQMEIIKILIKNDCTYTLNKNGFFINLNLVNPNILKEITTYLEFSKKNNVLIDNLINERENIVKID